MLEDLRKAIAATGTAGHTLIIEGVDALSDDLQLTLIEMIKTFGTGPVNLQVIGLSQLPLAQLHQAGRLRAELIYGLSVLPVAMPPLAVRPSDIPALADAHLARMRPTEEDVAPRLTEAARHVLTKGDWSGNLPELRAVLMRAAICAANPPLIDEGDIDDALGRRSQEPAPHAAAKGDFSSLWHQLQPFFGAGVGLDTLVSRIEGHALSEAGGNVSAAARTLGLSRAKLDYRLRQAKGDDPVS